MRRILSLALAGFFVVGGVAACSGGGGSASKTTFCNTAKSLKDSSGLDSAFSGNDPKKLEAAAAAIKDLAGKAPSEIKADMQVMNDLFQQIAAAKGDLSKLMEVVLANQSKIEKAGKNIDAYTQKNCGFTLGSDSSSSSSDKSNGLSDLTNLSDLSSFSIDTDSMSSALKSLSSAFSNLSDLSNFSDFTNFTSPSN